MNDPTPEELAGSDTPTVSLTDTVRLDPHAPAGGGEERIEELSGLFDIRLRVPSDHFAETVRLASGGAGVVVRGRDPNLKRLVAVKFLRPEFKDKRPFVERFVREARATSQLEHPNIIPVHELGCMDKHGVYYTMKHVNGVTLQKVLEELLAGNPDYAAKYSRGRLLEVFMDVCNAAAFAHSKGVINRDLKPENILLGDFGEVMVLDWGLVKLIHGGPEPAGPGAALPLSNDPGLTVDGSVSGTPAYMPPEQALGLLEELDERSDIYCLGAILYHILTYSPPFDGGSIHEVLDHVVEGAFPPPRRKAPRLKIPPELEAICLKAMSLERPAPLPDGGGVARRRPPLPRRLLGQRPARPGAGQGLEVVPAAFGGELHRAVDLAARLAGARRARPGHALWLPRHQGCGRPPLRAGQRGAAHGGDLLPRAGAHPGGAGRSRRSRPGRRSWSGSCWPPRSSSRTISRRPSCSCWRLRPSGPSPGLWRSGSSRSRASSSSSTS